MKTLDCNNLKLGSAIVLNTMSERIDFGFKRSRVRVWVRKSAPVCIFLLVVISIHRVTCVLQVDWPMLHRLPRKTFWDFYRPHAFPIAKLQHHNTKIYSSITQSCVLGILVLVLEPQVLICVLVLETKYSLTRGFL